MTLVAMQIFSIHIIFVIKQINVFLAVGGQNFRASIIVNTTGNTGGTGLRKPNKIKISIAFNQIKHHNITKKHNSVNTIYQLTSSICSGHIVRTGSFIDLLS